MGLNYSGKTVRPGYGQLDGAVSYINRLTFETGNPYLKPTKMQTVEYMTQWRQFLPSMFVTRALPFIVVAGRVALTTISPSCTAEGVSLITPMFPERGTVAI